VVHRSTDGGVSWVTLSWPDPSLGLPVVPWEGAVHPAAPDRIYRFGEWYTSLSGMPGGLFAIQVLGAEPLLLRDGRFEVRAGFRDLAGRYGAGRPLPLTGEAGAFTWREAPRQAVKVLNGRPVNGRFWAFAAGLSPFESTVTVLDRASGAHVDLVQPAGEPLSRADLGTLPPLPEEPGASGGGSDGGAEEGEEAAAETAAPAPGPCTPDPATLCLLDGRFQLRLAWRGPGGAALAARALPLADGFGAFAFASEGNLEVVLRAVDGRAVNGRFWLLVGGLTDGEYTLTVSDTATGAVRRYGNRAGQLASFADFEAFAP
jgi:hypothetical protein